MLKTLLLFLQLSGTVDRIEDDWVIVEWKDGSFSDIPVSVFPRVPREGERFSIRLKPAHSGPGLALPGQPPRISTSAGLIDLPPSPKPKPGHRYQICIRFSEETGCRFPHHHRPGGQQNDQKP